LTSALLRLRVAVKGSWQVLQDNLLSSPLSSPPFALHAPATTAAGLVELEFQKRRLKWLK